MSTASQSLALKYSVLCSCFPGYAGSVGQMSDFRGNAQQSSYATKTVWLRSAAAFRCCVQMSQCTNGNSE